MSAVPPRPTPNPSPKHGGQHGPSRDRRVAERAGRLATAEAQVVELTAERDQLTAERDQLRTERDQLTGERDQLTAELNQLKTERDQLTAERDSQIAENAAETRKRKKAEESSEQQKRELEKADGRATKMVLDSLRMQEMRLVENHSKAMAELKRQSELQLAEKQGEINTLKDKEDTHFRVRCQLRDENTALLERVRQLEADITQERLARKGGGGKK